MIGIREPRAEDLSYIARHMRGFDRLELKALNGVSPIRGLRMSAEHSLSVRVATVDGVPVAVFGVGEDGLSPYTEKGVIWFLGTDEVGKHGRDLLRGGIWFVKFCLGRFEELTNLIHGKNAPALSFARHLLKHFEGSLAPEGLGQRLIIRRS